MSRSNQPNQPSLRIGTQRRGSFNESARICNSKPRVIQYVYVSAGFIFLLHAFVEVVGCNMSLRAGYTHIGVHSFVFKHTHLCHG